MVRASELNPRYRLSLTQDRSNIMVAMPWNLEGMEHPKTDTYLLIPKDVFARHIGITNEIYTLTPRQT
jgi:hypothetical protein